MCRKWVLLISGWQQVGGGVEVREMEGKSCPKEEVLAEWKSEENFIEECYDFKGSKMNR